MENYFPGLVKDYCVMSNGNNLPDQQPSDQHGSNSSIELPALTPEVAIINAVSDITTTSIKCFTDYQKCLEHEITERKKIAATLQAIVSQINANKEMFLAQLENDFSERNRLYDLAEKSQEKALELGDKEMLGICYNFIINIYNNPASKNAYNSTIQDVSFSMLK